jgi:ubiquitin C-terminal hydrolase
VRGKVTYVEMKDDPGATDAELSRRWWTDYGRWNKSPIKTIFAGQLASSVTCTYCRHVSKSFDPFWDLSLPIPVGGTVGNAVGGRGGGGGEDAVPLAECLRAFLTAEQLTGENRFHCPRCKRDRECTKLLRISRCPKVLVVHLKRFVFNRWNSAKISAAVSFPLRGLRLGDSASGGCSGGDDGGERSDGRSV